MQQLDIIKIPEEWVLSAGRGVNVFVLDGHIDTESSVYKDKVFYYKMLNSGNFYSTCHCDSVCKIISDVAPFAKIGVYQVLKNKKTDIFGFNIALDEICNQDFDVLNISMSSVKNEDYIYRKIENISKKSIIVASLSNRDMESYPAKYDNVISVSSFTNNYQDADIYCSDRIEAIKSRGNSMSTAFISGICALAKSYDKSIDKERFLKLLLQK